MIVNSAAVFSACSILKMSCIGVALFKSIFALYPFSCIICQTEIKTVGDSQW